MSHKAALLLAAVFLIFSPRPHAAPYASTERPYYLEAQPLMKAVVVWARQSELQLIWRMGSPVRQHAPEVVGVLSPETALKRLLAGSGLTYSFTNSRKVVIRPETAVVNALPGATKGTDALIDEIIVTGSHIRGAAPAGSLVVVVDAEEIRRGGYATAEQIVRALPQNIRSGHNGEAADARFSSGAGASRNVTSASGANLRGAGASATVTLVNGHRIAPSGQGPFTDISLIPAAAISRIEYLLDGASAVYGTDAIAGVVNIILKDDFDGFDTHLRYGTTTPSGRNEAIASQTLGAKWGSGSILAIGSWVDQSELSTKDRSFTRDVPQPASIFPTNEQASVHVAGNQALGESWRIHADGQHGRTQRYSLGSASAGHWEFPVDIVRTNAFTRLQYQKIDGWDISLKAHLSREDIDLGFLYLPAGSVAAEIGPSEIQSLTQQQWATGIAASGELASVPAGKIRVAVGAEHREEEYVRRLSAPTTGREDVARIVNAAYVELHVPILGDEQTAPHAPGMSVSLAGRYDDYSDVGGIFNPKFGLSWAPIAGLELRSTYSHSFRAPAAGAELLSTSRGTQPLVAVYSFTAADDHGTVPVAFLAGAHNVHPEKARHWTAGFTLRPAAIQGLRLDVTYYDISYSGRIVAPPLDLGALANPALQSFIKNYSSPEQLQAQLARETAGNATYVDRTRADFTGGAFGPSPLSLTTYIFDARVVNASEVRTNGFDAALSYSATSSVGRLDLGLSANYIREMETVYAPGAPRFDSVGTTGNPAGLRIRASASFTRGGWSGALAANFTDDYRDTAAAAYRRIRSYTTFDGYLSYTFHNSGTRALDGLSIGVSASNLFNENPPHIAGSLATKDATYDSANAHPLGRMIAMEVGKRW